MSVRYRNFNRNCFIVFFLLILSACQIGFGKTPTLFSVQMHSVCGSAEKHRQALEWASEMGAGQVRDELFWHLVEQKKGVYKIPEPYLANLRMTRKAGIDTILILDYTNDLYDDGLAPTSDEALDAFAGYAAYMAKELKGIVPYFEVWNEPNTDGFWRPRQNARHYTALLKRVYPAIKKANPDAVVLGCSLAGLDESFLEVVAEEGGLEAMDAISVHPYCPPASPEGRGIFEQLKQFSEKVDRLAGRSMPVWITEMGWPTQESGGVSELRQAEMVARTYLIAASIPQLKTLGWYWLGPDGPDCFWAEDRFSLTHQDGSAKPARRAFGQLSHLLRDATFERYLIDTPQVKAQLYQCPDGVLVTLWSADDKLHQVMARGVDKLLTLSGHENDVEDDFDSIEFEIDGEPLLLLAKKTPIVTPGLMAIERPQYELVAPGRSFMYRAPYRAGGSAIYHLYPRWEEKFIEKGVENGPLRFFIDTETPYGPGRADLYTKVLHQQKLRVQAYTFEVGPPLRVLLQPSLGLKGERQCDLQILSAVGAFEEPVSCSIEVNGAASETFPRSIEIKNEKENILFPFKSDLAGGEMARVRVTLHPQDERAIVAEDTLAFTQAHHRETPPKIDGDFSDWDFEQGDTIFLGRKDQYDFPGMHWDGPDDASARVVMAWDRDWLYFAADVTDDIYSDTASGVDVYKNDGFELYFDTDPVGDAMAESYNEDDHQWGVCTEGGKAVVYRWSQRSGKSLLGRAAVQKVKGGYRLEAKIPAGELTSPSGAGSFSGQLEQGMHFGFSVALNDDDSPDFTHPFHQDLQLQWSRGRNAFMDPRVFADLFLVK